MAYESFDYGTSEEIKDPGVEFKTPTEGSHSARLRDLIHVGMFRESFNGTKKKPFPQVIAVFELMEDDDFEEDGVTPLTITKAFPLKKGDKSLMTKLLAALDPQKKATGFDDLIGAACTIICKGGAEKKEDGTSKYVNFGGIAGLSAKFSALLQPLVVKGSGHVRFDQITKEIILSLHPILDVNRVLMESEDYKGSKAEAIINEIRKDNPEYAVYKKKDKEGNGKESSPSGIQAETPIEREPALDADEDF